MPALENLSKTVPHIDEDQKMDLLHSPFKGTTTQFGGELAKLQKANPDGAITLTVFFTAAVPPTSYDPGLTWAKVRSYNYKSSFSQGRGGRRHDRSAPSDTRNKLSEDSQVLTVTVPQEYT